MQYLNWTKSIMFDSFAIVKALPVTHGIRNKRGMAHKIAFVSIIGAGVHEIMIVL